MKKHLYVAAGLIFHDGKIFAAKRGASPYPYLAHKYEFPGGKIETGESGEEAVNVGGLFAATTFEYPDFIVTLSVYECEMLSEFVLKEHESFAWLSPKDLCAEEWAPADADMIETLKRVFGE